jgi:hypothetical protein
VDKNVGVLLAILLSDSTARPAGRLRILGRAPRLHTCRHGSKLRFKSQKLLKVFIEDV